MRYNSKCEKLDNKCGLEGNLVRCKFCTRFRGGWQAEPKAVRMEYGGFGEESCPSTGQ